MLNQTSTTTIARTLLLAGILLAVTVLAVRSFTPAFAEETTGTLVIRNFPENSEDAVATYSVMDPEGEIVDWKIVPSTESPDDSEDSGDFEVSDQGELTFMNDPDYEDPADAGQDNVYKVQVRASDPDDNTHTITVTVYVRNVNETGTVEFGTIQPRQGVDLIATLTDDDDITTATSTWMWERSADGSTDWTEATTTTEKLDAAGDSEASTYAPVKDDVGHYLRVTVSYTDQEGPRKMSEPKVTANKVGSSLVNTAPYFVYAAAGEIPDGADEEVDDRIPDGTTLTRAIAENSAEDADVGSPVKAEDDNGDNLTYAFDMDSDIANNGNVAGVDNVETVTISDATFDIDRSTGQITVGANTELNHEGTASYNVVVTATDPSGEYDSISVRINVTNVQENPTIAAGPTNITQTEITDVQSPAGTTTRDGTAVASDVVNNNTAIKLATYTATDHEDSDARLLKWSLSGSHANRVVICNENETNLDNCGIENITSTNEDPSTVDLVLTELPDYEAPANRNNAFAVKLTVTDRTRPTALTTSKDVTISVINVDEPGVVVLSHKQPEVGVDITASVTDPDGVSRGRATWGWYANGQMIAGSRGGSATFRPRNSTSTTPQIIDIDTTLTAVASYTDGHGAGKTATNDTVSDAVQDVDVNNDDPIFRAAATTTSVELTFRENATPPVLGLESAVTVVDDDFPDDLIYTLNRTGDHALFAIPDRLNREIALAEGTTFNYEAKQSYTLDLKMTDPSGESATLRVVVKITDFQEAPVVPESGRQVSYPEIKNSVPNTDTVYTYTATDDDDRRIGRGRQLTWRISDDDANNTHSAFFEITERGALSFKSPPDFETTNAPANDIYFVKLRVTDNGDANGGDIKSTEVSVQVTVTNVDEPGNVTFDKLQPLEKTDLIATLADDDGVTDTNATTTWLWERSQDGSTGWTKATTTVESSEAGDTVTNSTYAPVAADVGHFLRVTVSYRDAEDTDPLNPAKMSVPKVTANAVARNLVNDEPFFVYTSDDEIPEGLKVGDKIPDDTDTDTATVVRKIAENSAEDTTIGEPIKADDEDRDVNNNKDVLTYAFDTDPDADQKTDAVTVTVPTADGATFDIDRSTGQISVGANSELNYEATPNTHEVTVTATDPSGKFDEISVRIDVTNVEENPSIEGAAEISLTEVIDPGAETPAATTTVGETVLAIQAVNVDGSDTAPRRALPLASFTASDDEDDATTRDPKALKWTLSGVDADRFVLFGLVNGDTRITDDIDASGIEDIISSNPTISTVQLLLKELPDYENPANSSNTYSVKLTVTDTTHPKGLTDTHDVTVKVTNVNEDGTVKLLNRQPEIGVPIKAELADPDQGVTIVGWQWSTAGVQTDVGDAGWTAISGATSETYTPVSGDMGKDLAARATYRDAANVDDEFTHNVDESELTASSSADFFVKDADSNNQAPVFPDQDEDTPGDQSDSTTRSILEDAGPEIRVEDPVYARDTDGADNQSGGDVLTYTLGGPDAAYFSVGQEDTDTTDFVGGQISVGKGTKFDFETKSTYTVTVTATDPSGASDTITVTINIQNVNEAPAVEMVEQLRLTGDTGPSIAENQTGTVTTFRATGPGSGTATWSVTGPDASSFAIAGGVLSVASALNFESPSDANRDRVYEITVAVQADTMSRNLPVRVTVTDVDEGGTVNLSSPGNEVKVGVQLTAQLDEGDEEVVTGWQWSSGGSNTGPWTNIFGETNNTYTPVDGDVGNYLRITVSYTDATFGSDSLSSVTPSAVSAASTADNPGSMSLSPSSGLVSGDSVTAALTDPDNPTNQVWLWQRSANGSTNWSNISGATSASYITTAADAGNYLRATVTYDDSSGTGLTLDASTSSAVKLHRYDGNASGAIERNEVIEAINDYLFGTGTERGEVIDVINLYLFG